MNSSIHDEYLNLKSQVEMNGGLMPSFDDWVTRKIELKTAVKCAYLAWQQALMCHAEPERAICREFDINLDSLYALTWAEIKGK